ncbi:adrenocortical dysplasia protein homolog [Rhinophrynus dorsalis]
MPAPHSYIGCPWILDVIANYGRKDVKQKAVPAQLVEFVKMPDSASEDSQHPSAVVHISDRHYYIRGIITKEAQDILEREDEHFRFSDIKNKIVILKNFSVCFTEVEELANCEFYITVQHFSILPMETSTVELLNCNLNPDVRKMIKELWEHYMEELDKNSDSSDMNPTDGSLTQLLNDACQEKLSDLKALAQQCLNLGPSDNEETPAITRWGAEMKKDKNTNTFSIPINILLIPPEEEAALKQMTEFRNDTELSSDNVDPVVDVHSKEETSSTPYSTALPCLCDVPLDDIPESQSGNPWNKLQPLCLSLNSSCNSEMKTSFSVANKSREEDSVADPGSSISSQPVVQSIQSTAESQERISPLIFADESSIVEDVKDPGDITCKKGTNVDDNVNGNSCLSNGQKNSSPKLLQSSPMGGSSIGSRFSLSPIMLPGSEREISPKKIRRLLFTAEDSKECEISNLLCQPKERRSIKRKLISEDTVLPNAQNGEVPTHKTILPSGEKNSKVPDTDVELEHVLPLNLCKTGTTAFSASNENEKGKGQEVMQKSILRSPKVCDKGIVVKRTYPCKASLQFMTKPRPPQSKVQEEEAASTERPTTSRASLKELSVFIAQRQALTKEKHTLPVIDFNKAKMVHCDGTAFQYKYKPPSADLCACVNSLRLPTDLCEWAKKILSEQEKPVP